MAELRIAVDPASPAGDYTAKVEYRVLANGRVRLNRMWVEPPRERICTCGSDCAPGPFHTAGCPSLTVSGVRTQSENDCSPEENAGSNL